MSHYLDEIVSKSIPYLTVNQFTGFVMHNLGLSGKEPHILNILQNMDGQKIYQTAYPSEKWEYEFAFISTQEGIYTLYGLGIKTRDGEEFLQKIPEYIANHVVWYISKSKRIKALTYEKYLDYLEEEHNNATKNKVDMEGNDLSV